MDAVVRWEEQRVTNALPGTKEIDSKGVMVSKPTCMDFIALGNHRVAYEDHRCVQPDGEGADLRSLKSSWLGVARWYIVGNLICWNTRRSISGPV